MESPKFWLPPLNSHEDYKTIVSVSQTEEPMIEHKCQEKNFSIHIHVEVAFYTDSKEITLKGLSLRHEFHVPCCYMTCSSIKQIKKFISGILCDMHIPFQLDHILFSQKHLKTNWFENYNLSAPEDADKWVVKFQEFLRVMTQETYNSSTHRHHNVLPLHLKIDKYVRISSCEFEMWLSWFHQKESLDPSFHTAYLEAICRPRTIQELFDGTKNLNLKLKEAILKSYYYGFDKTWVSWFHGQEEERVIIDPSFRTALAYHEEICRANQQLLEAENDNESSTQDCVVCLEELCPGKEVVRLPCSHIYHKACIGQWLKKSNKCPLCRSGV